MGTREQDLRNLILRNAAKANAVLGREPTSGFEKEFIPPISGWLAFEGATAIAHSANTDSDLARTRHYYGLDSAETRFSAWGSQVDKAVLESPFAEAAKEDPKYSELPEGKLKEKLVAIAEEKLRDAEGNLEIKLVSVCRIWKELFADKQAKAMAEGIKLWDLLPRPEIRQELILFYALTFGVNLKEAHTLLAKAIAKKPCAIRYDIEKPQSPDLEPIPVTTYVRLIPPGEVPEITFIGARNALFTWKQKCVEELKSCIEGDGKATDGLLELRDRLEAGAKELLPQLYDRNLRTRLVAAKILSTIAEGFKVMEKAKVGDFPDNPYPKKLMVDLHCDEEEDLSQPYGIRITNQPRIVELSSTGLFKEISNAIEVECCRSSQALHLQGLISDGHYKGDDIEKAQNAACIFGASKQSARELLHSCLNPIDGQGAWDFAVGLTGSEFRDRRLARDLTLVPHNDDTFYLGSYDAISKLKFPLARQANNLISDAIDLYNSDLEYSY